ncbi:MAG: serine/threonine protein kinase/tetratricopeptide (TPR) repeat protein [Myxococcota bacterium]|jgi:serine/threonine protein kinase/tetratricopeptide (TPR) repeat protein
MSGARLGAFTLHRLIGRGGMASVWLATRDNDTPAAVKVLTAKHAQTLSYQVALRNEVRAAADLCHPNIVLLLDHGEVDAAAETVSGGRLVAGTPWLAMEYASGQSLHRRHPGLGWPQLRGWLLELLSALSHAHARGVIHRDIKPANLLLSQPIDQPMQLKVTDFGLAYATDGSIVASPAAGTPAYMAPEQRAGRVEDYGPWTDLYGVGRTALSLLTGSATGEGLSSVQLPEGMEGWLLRMLAFETGDRFQRAADAAHALSALDGPLKWSELPLAESISLTASSAPSTLLLSSFSIEGDGLTAEVSLSDLPMPPILRPPLPEALPPAEAPPPAGLRAGIRLVSLRRPALTGRQALREQLWAALGAARSAPQVVILDGPAGVGKSRLASWLVENAAEVGAAEVFSARHAPDTPPGAGLSALLARALGCAGLRGQRLHQRLADRLSRLDMPSAEERRAVAALTSAEEIAAFKDIAERHALTWRILRRLSGDRIAAVWLDDAQWDPQALRFAASTLGEGGASLLVLTVQAEALAEQPESAAALEALAAQPGVCRLPVGPLPSDDHRQLIATLLGQQTELTDAIAEKTDGNPLFAVQLVRGWVQRGDLHPGPNGLVLADGARLTVPDDLYAIWASRLDRLLPGGEGRDALEIAATLGMEVSQEEWHSAAALAGVTIPAALAERLLAERLAESTSPRKQWTFAHTMVRESIRRAAAEGGRLLRWHAACAEMLIDAGGDAAERIGAHLFAAEAHAASMPWLLAGARLRRIRGEASPARALLRQHGRAADAQGWAEDDPRRAEGWAEDARAAFSEGDTVAAQALSARAHALGAPIARARAAQVRGRIAHRQQDMAAATRFFDEAVTIAAGAGDAVLQARALQLLAGAHLYQGRTADAARAHEQALQVLPERAEPIDGAMNHYGLAGIALQRRDLVAAREHARAACDGYAAAGHRLGVATSLNLLGEVLLTGGDIDQAAVCYQDAVVRYGRLGVPDRALPMANLGRLHLLRGDFAAARAALEQAGEAVAGTRLARWSVRFRICMMPCHASDDEVEAVEGCLREAEGLAARGVVAPEWRDVARQTAALLAANGRDALAARARAFANN